MPVDYSAYMQNKRDLVPNLIRSLAGAYGAYEKTQAANQMAAQQKQMQIDFASVRDNLNAGPQDYANLMMKYPEQQQRIKGVYDMLGEDKRRAKQAEALQLFSLLEGGENEMALKSLNDRRLAAETSGNQKEAQQAQTMIDMINSNPASAKNMAGMYLSMTMGPDKFADTYKKIQETRELRAKEDINVKTAAAEYNLKEAQVKKVLKETEKLDAEAQKAALELEAAKDPTTGIVDQEKRFNAEKKLRDEYTKNTAGVVEAEQAFERMRISGNDETGQGDVALVTDFMKVLDPGSVVRETEFATARDTAGLYARLANWLKQRKTGEFLSKQDRAKFVNLAAKYANEAKKHRAKIKKTLMNTVNEYGLNAQNIFEAEKDHSKKDVVDTVDKTDEQNILNQADKILGL